MTCLALSLQPATGPDILLQTREWFPPSRALSALTSFRQTRQTFFSSVHGKDPMPSEDLDSSLGDDPLAASSGQLIVGVESKYRIVYRRVNSIYVVAITTVDLVNVFDCANVVNQAVGVVVVACRGVDVNPEKIHRKYAEVYMALDIVLRGVSGIRLAYILSSMHGDGIARMVQLAAGAETLVRGANSWLAVEGAASAHQVNMAFFSASQFELPPEALAAGEEFATAHAPAMATGVEVHDQLEESSAIVAEKDPFAASDAINKPEALGGEFKKSKDRSGPSDLSLALAGLDVTPLPPPVATQSTFIAVEGFEGEYGGIEFSNEQTTLKEAFEGFDTAFGGGLDASEFVGNAKVPKPLGLGGLEELQSGQPATKASVADGPIETLQALKAPEMKGPQMYISEEINAEFRESVLARVGLQGIIYLKTMPPKQSGGKETEFSFGIDGTTGIKRAVMQSSRINSLGNGLFHIRTSAADDPIPILKYSLRPQFSPLPLRVRLIQRYSGTLLSVMIQYASNPELPAPLSDVAFVLKLPVDPTLLKVSPKAILNRAERELRWNVEEVPLKGPPGRLRARMPVDSGDQDAESEIDVVGMVRFSVEAASTLSGVSLRHVSDDKMDFYQVNHRYTSGIYMCCQY
ncbi:uncharacterized protein LOC131256113 [Magnolia sinica]|uniref:uncharacterized protein LOC131256113 n=1 Tax=Magnolia sinica TaxID=86752 RepID=UPI002659C200|nr:uncharacterized protein LOC131256113 [Magnolia sinica]